MSNELDLLIWTLALTVIQMVIAVLGAMLQVGLPALAGNREDLAAIVGWSGRAQRAHRNMLESLVIFAILVFVARAMNISNDMTILGAQLFFWGRIVYAAIYIIGIPWLRTGAWAVGLAGLILIFLQLI